MTLSQILSPRIHSTFDLTVAEIKEEVSLTSHTLCRAEWLQHHQTLPLFAKGVTCKTKKNSGYNLMSETVSVSVAQ